MTEKFDPFDVAALEKAVNDSAVRVSTIWVSYLVFALYLVIAVGTVSHRQLFLEEPVKLPTLNIDLPLLGFFFLAPILFVIFHTYVLLQVLLLGRTAAAYNEAVDRAIKRPPGNALVRQRLANTLFAQIFAGSPREREGFIGWLLTLVAWVTLAIAPVLVLLVFQFKFLPYQSNFVTWTHRVLILTELAAVLLLWPLALDARREIEWFRLVRHPVALVSTVLFVLITMSVATFPGEPHVNLFTGQPLLSVKCDRWRFARTDRLDLSFVYVVDDEKLRRIDASAKDKGLPPGQREPTQQFLGRNFRCGVIFGADLRGVDFKLVDLRGAVLGSSIFDKAGFSLTNLQQANLSYARFQDAVFNEVQFHGAILTGAYFQGAHLIGAQFQGAKFHLTQFQGANLTGAHFQGANLTYTDLTGADLAGAQFQGAHVFNVFFQGARLIRAAFQGANLENSQFQGADLTGAQFQGANLTESELELALLSKASLWRATITDCTDARVTDPIFDPVIPIFDPASRTTDIFFIREPNVVPATPANVERFVESVVTLVPDLLKSDFRNRVRDHLAATRNEEDLINTWRNCVANAAKMSQAEYDQKHATMLGNLACNASSSDRKEIASGIIRNWLSEKRVDFSRTLARVLLGKDGMECAAIDDLDKIAKEQVRNFANAPTPKP